ncbi:DUF924 family protein [Ferrovibrio xuzhouensis]|uniref:DUF924 family protein n=1 Tax=Ferrovibrio xuzhouensis TaxID=1576914 RepID=A0ABV7VC97_9PROT
MTTTAADILDFWFDRPGSAARGEPLTPRQCWWRKDDAFDAEIRTRFGAAVETALQGGFAGWADDADGTLALLILLDQFPRNIFRDTARAFAGDAQARSVARGAIDRGFDIVVAPVQRQFFYMPFQHSEDLADQEFGMLLFAALEKDLPGQKTFEFAERHRVIIAQFGRFPHRNAALGRDSTPEETEFLRQPGSSF